MPLQLFCYCILLFTIYFYCNFTLEHAFLFTFLITEKRKITHLCKTTEKKMIYRSMMRTGYILSTNAPKQLNIMGFFYTRYLKGSRTESTFIDFCSTIVPINPSLAQHFIAVIAKDRMYSILACRKKFPNLCFDANQNKDLFANNDQLISSILSSNILKKYPHMVKSITILAQTNKHYSLSQKKLMNTVKDTNQVDPDSWWIYTAKGWTSHMDYKSTTKIFRVASGHIFCTSNMEEYDVGAKKLLEGLNANYHIKSLFKDYINELINNPQYNSLSWGQKNELWHQFLLTHHTSLGDFKPSMVFLIDLPYEVKNITLSEKYGSSFNTKSFSDKTSTLDAIIDSVKKGGPLAIEGLKKEPNVSNEALQMLLNTHELL